MFFVQENRSEVTTSLISSCFVLYSFGAGHHQQSRCIIRRDWQASGCRMAGMLSEGQEEVRGYGRQGQDPRCKRQGRLGEDTISACHHTQLNDQQRTRELSGHKELQRARLSRRYQTYHRGGSLDLNLSAELYVVDPRYSTPV